MFAEYPITARKSRAALSHPKSLTAPSRSYQLSYGRGDQNSGFHNQRPVIHDMCTHQRELWIL